MSTSPIIIDYRSPLGKEYKQIGEISNEKLIWSRSTGIQWNPFEKYVKGVKLSIDIVKIKWENKSYMIRLTWKNYSTKD